MKVLVTGSAGFIGYHTAEKLLQRGDQVVGFDNVNDYYDVNLKRARLENLKKYPAFTFIEANLANLDIVMKCFDDHQFDRVIHLGAQAGVRYSLENPHSYVESNIVAFTNILEACRKHKTPHLVYASTSSVYGSNVNMPFSEEHTADHPLQFYAATKRANELMAHSYSHLFNLPTTSLRFFTVYGPWGRPDMALFKFTKNIAEGKAIDLYNHGNHTRDFTYVDDIVEGVIRASDDIPTASKTWDPKNPNPSHSHAPYRVFNIGNNDPVSLIEYVEAIEEALGKKAIKNLLPLQAGDVLDTYADTSKLQKTLGYKPKVSVKEGVTNFVNWYKEFYKV